MPRRLPTLRAALRLLALALPLTLATAHPAVAAYAPVTASLSSTNVLEGETFQVRLAASPGTTFPTGATLRAFISNSSYWGYPDQDIGTFALPAGQASAEFPMILDNAQIGPLDATALTIKLAGTGFDLLTSGLPITVRDNDAVITSPTSVTVPGTTASPAPNPPSTPTAGAGSSDPATQSTPVEVEFLPGRPMYLKNDRFRVRLNVNQRVFGYLNVRYHHSAIAGRWYMAYPSANGQFVWIKLRRNHWGNVFRRRGGVVTVRFKWFEGHTDHRVKASYRFRRP